jgi:hypothetical protein
MTGRSNSQRRRLDRRAELVDVDRTRDSAGWRGLFRGGHHFELEQDGTKIAAISTLLRRAESFGNGVLLRRTEIRFADGDVWEILTRAPGPRQEKQVFGVHYRASWNAHDRVVEVIGRGIQMGRRLAHLAGDPPTMTFAETLLRTAKPVEVETSDGRSVTLNHSRSRLTEKTKQAFGDGLTITKKRARYLITPTSPVSLEAALLHWHLMLGDYRVANSYSGG